MNWPGLLREYLYVCTQFVWKCLMRALHTEHRWLVWRVALWRFRLYFTNVDMVPTGPKHKKKSPYKRQKSAIRKQAVRKRLKLYRQAGGKCQLCHCKVSGRKVQIHHVLPIDHFPELGADERNLMIVCPDCHREIHQNPFLNARLIKQRARKLGVKYKKVYSRM